MTRRRRVCGSARRWAAAGGWEECRTAAELEEGRRRSEWAGPRRWKRRGEEEGRSLGLLWAEAGRSWSCRGEEEQRRWAESRRAERSIAVAPAAEEEAAAARRRR